MAPTTSKAVAYVRVSTTEQGRSGLGLEAQRARITEYATSRNLALVHTYVEVESGADSERPELARALAHARRSRCPIIVAKLDRLSRSVAYIATMMERGTPFLVADLPDADPMMLHVYAVVAEQERRMISARTRAAMGAARARGVIFGNPDPEALRFAQVRGAARNVSNARAFAANVRPLIEHAQRRGLSLRAIVAELNARGVPTARGGDWHVATVRNVLARAHDPGVPPAWCGGVK